MADIYRKSSLEKLSSPEQLDKMIVITSPSFWIALVGAGLIIVVALMWAIFGCISVNVDVQGIYVNKEGTYSVYSETSGVVNQVLIKVGDEVNKGDLIARLNTDDIEQKIENYESRIKKVEDITMDSEADTVTADNKELVDIKSQMWITDQQEPFIYSQFETTKAAIIDQLKLESQQYEEQLEKCDVVSTVSGKVSSVSVVQGSAVNQGSELIKVQQGEEDDDVVVCYVSLSSGKKITEGMEVLVYPTTVNKQEYGHMTGTVIKVDSYVTSTEELRTQLGNDTLVESFLSNGPVLAVVCKLEEDSSTASGYAWSSSKGKDVMLAEGTMVEASVVLEQRAPITMLIPYIKEKFTIKTQTSTQ